MYHQYVPQSVHRFLVTAAFVVAAVALSIGLQTFAWSPPASTPLNSDADAPLHVGAAAQTKTGNLQVSGDMAVGGGFTGATDVALHVTGRIRVNPAPASNYVLASDGVGGDATWKDPGTLPTVQKRVTQTCAAGSAITAINADGSVACNRAMKAGAVTIPNPSGSNVNVTVTGLGMPDATYAATLNVSGGSQGCSAAQISGKTASQFTITAGDRCEGHTFSWIAVDY